MPQFDTFIFSSILLYLTLTLFIFLYQNYNYILPQIGSTLKLRFKLLSLENKGIAVYPIVYSISGKYLPIAKRSFSSFSFRNNLGAYLYAKSKQYSAWVQSLYEIGINTLLTYKLTRFILLMWFTLLIKHYAFWEWLLRKFNSENLIIVFMILGVVATRLDIMFPWGFIFIFSVLRLHSAFQRMSSYYRKNPNKLVQHFPDVQNPKRQMWTRAGKAIIEAAESPGAKTLVAMGVTATVYKALQVYDNATQAHLQEKALESAADTADKDREASKQESDKNRQSTENIAAEDRKPAERTADIAEVEAGIMTLEEYKEKWKSS